MRAPRALSAALFVAALLLPAASNSAGAQEADESTGTATAIASQDGWWYRAQGPQQGEPSNPLRGAITPVLPAPSTVPGNAIAVGAAVGEPDKVAAVGIVLDAPIDAFADTMKLTLKEADADQANANQANAVIIACPITGFWAGVKNGQWIDKPTCDDSQAVRGQRAEDGTWTFDLAVLATGWIDGTLAQNGVLLMEAVDAPMSFQVSFQDISTGNVGLEFSAFGGGFSGTSDFVFEDTGSEDTSFGDTTFDDVAPVFEEPSFTTTDDLSVSVPVTSAPVATPAAGTPTRVAQPVASVGDPGRAGKLFGNLPLGVLLLALAVLGGAAGLALLLGPDAGPTAVRRRTGGVSQALAARAAARD